MSRATWRCDQLHVHAREVFSWFQFPDEFLGLAVTPDPLWGHVESSKPLPVDESVVVVSRVLVVL